jgi:hypothetical protein
VICGWYSINVAPPYLNAQSELGHLSKAPVGHFCWLDRVDLACSACRVDCHGTSEAFGEKLLKTVATLLHNTPSDNGKKPTFWKMPRYREFLCVTRVIGRNTRPSCQLQHRSQQPLPNLFILICNQEPPTATNHNLESLFQCPLTSPGSPGCSC